MKRVKPKIKSSSMFAITDYNSTQYEKENLRKWCIEQAIKINETNTNTVTSTAKEIYDWVTK